MLIKRLTQLTHISIENLDRTELRDTPHLELVYVGNHILGHRVTLAVSVHRPRDSPGPRPRACKRHHLRNFVLSLVIGFLGVLDTVLDVIITVIDIVARTVELVIYKVRQT